MFVLGLILILLSAGALVAVLASGTDDQAAMYGGGVHLPTLVVFLAGAAALLLFIMGLELVRSGVKRATEHRKNTRRLRKLEKREEQRRRETPDTTAGDQAAAPAATTTTGTGPTTGTGTTTGTGPTTGTGTGPTTGAGGAPSENPPPR